ncbi:MAG: NADP-dependent phosphogluconate dehydrogenase [Chitinophagaceae bacterium]
MAKENDFDFGMIGLGTMGSNLLLNMADHGFSVIGYDKNMSKTLSLEASALAGTNVRGVNELEEMVNLLRKPRKIMLLVPAGKIVDDVIIELLPLVEENDIIIDGGNSHYTDTTRRISLLAGKKIFFIGAGVSGGESGARTGPSIMPGGNTIAYGHIKPVLEAIAAKVDNEPCVAYCGNGAAGHYVKMVHNGIEYAIMQLISECYDLMKNGMGLNNEEMASIFSKWNEGPMKSFLIEITVYVLQEKDPESGKFLVDLILDQAGSKGTGKWTSQESFDRGVPIPTIDIAVSMRAISSLKSQREEAAEIYESEPKRINASSEEIIPLLHDALYFSITCSYAQGLALLQESSTALEMDIPLQDVVRIWRGGCIIRSAMLGTFHTAFEKDKHLANILLDLGIANEIKQLEHGIREVATLIVRNDYPASAILSAFTYFNAYHRKRLPANLLQAHRDFFGAHTYQRIDREGSFHTEWKQKD